MLRRMWSSIRTLFRQSEFETGMQDEFRLHLEHYTADLIRSGLKPAEAARRARIEFGSMANAEQECREARGMHYADELIRQLRYSARTLRKSPAFSITAIATLAICLAANLTIFALTDAILIRPLPFPNAGELVTIFNTYPSAGVDRDGSSIANYYERRGKIPSLSSLAMYRPGNLIFGGQQEAARVPVQFITPGFFETLNVPLAMGREFSDAETTYQTDKVAVITDGFWRVRLNQRTDVIGQRIDVNGSGVRIVGVLPAGYRFLSSQADLYLPLASTQQYRASSQRHSGGNSTHMIARLAPGATLELAQAQIDAQNAALEPGYPGAKQMADAGFRSLVAGLHADHVAPVRSSLMMLQSAALILLLIGVVNLANLLLIRSSGRMKELALRQALGAGRGHIWAEVMVETGLISLLGAAGGFALTAGAIGALSRFAIESLPLGTYVQLDLRSGVAAAIAAMGITLILAVPVAWFHIRRHAAPGVQSGARTGNTSHGAERMRQAFVVSQLALSLVLLTGAALLAMSLERAMAVSPGFEPKNVWSAQLTLPAKQYPDLLQQLRQLPGVASAGFGTNLPLSGYSGKSAITVKGHVLRAGESPHGLYSYGVGGDYFRTLGMRLVAGRYIDGEDSDRGRRLCVVDEDLARRYWPGSDPLGKQLWEGYKRDGKGDEKDLFTVVGVVTPVRQESVTEPAGQGAVYFPYSFRSEASPYFAVRTSLPVETLAAKIREVILKATPAVPLSNIKTMEARVDGSLEHRRSPALIAVAFSTLALLLTSIGTYGVLSYTVAQKRREIGVRMALGAAPGQIGTQFLSLAMRMLLPGTALGIGGSWIVGQSMRAQLFEVQPWNLTAVGLCALVIAVVTLVACLIPSERAARISPTEAIAEQ